MPAKIASREMLEQKEIQASWSQWFWKILASCNEVMQKLFSYKYLNRINLLQLIRMDRESIKGDPERTT